MKLLCQRSLAESAILGTLPTPLQYLLSAQIQPRKLPPGHDICLQGAPANKIWLLHLGRVIHLNPCVLLLCKCVVLVLPTPLAASI